MQTVFSLTEKVALITGAGSGIGRSIAELFAQQGANVQVVDLDQEAADAATHSINSAGGQATAWRVDVADQSAVQELVQAIVDRHGELGILVNNAGCSHIGSVESTNAADFDKIYSVNVKGVYHCLQAAIPSLKRAGGGCILNMGSIASLVGLKDRFAYSMSKGAVLSMTLSVAADYLRDNIRCNCICPARIHTPFVDGFLERHYPGREQEMFDKLSAAQPIGRMGTPREVASLALYLCSDEAAFVTGAAYPLDGGVTSLM